MSDRSLLRGRAFRKRRRWLALPWQGFLLSFLPLPPRFHHAFCDISAAPRRFGKKDELAEYLALKKENDETKAVEAAMKARARAREREERLVVKEAKAAADAAITAAAAEAEGDVRGEGDGGATTVAASSSREAEAEGVVEDEDEGSEEEGDGAKDAQEELFRFKAAVEEEQNADFLKELALGRHKVQGELKEGGGEGGRGGCTEKRQRCHEAGSRVEPLPE